MGATLLVVFKLITFSWDNHSYLPLFCLDILNTDKALKVIQLLGLEEVNKSI